MILYLKYLRNLLFPIAFLYAIIIWLRNILFDFNILKSHKFSLPVFCIGNLALGGTGKTPMTEYLIRILKTDYKVAFLSRGYKRHTKGFIIASKNITPKKIGDEPSQVKTKFPEITVAVDEKRVHGIQQLIRIKTDTNLIILDDAFQHRYVKASCNILLTDYTNLYYNDRLVPVGTLREYRSAKKRADIIVVTKCPFDLSDNEKKYIEKKINPLSHQQIFFSTLVYSALNSVFKKQTMELNESLSVLLVTGIVNPEPIQKFLKDKIANFESMILPDHYRFKVKDMETISRKYLKLEGKEKIIMITEKDAVKIKQLDQIPEIIRENIYILPIKIDFLFCQKPKFDNLIYNFSRKYIREN